MGVFFGPPREKRYDGFTANFTNPPIPTNASMSQFAAPLNKAEGSMQSIAVWSAVSLIASLTAELPIDVYRAGPASQPINAPDYLNDIGGDGYGTQDWIYQLLVSFLLRGNVYGKVLQRSPLGFPTQVSLYSPDDVTVRSDSDGVLHWRVSGQEVPAASMWHKRAYSVPGMMIGLSPVGYHAMSIGLGLAAQNFGVQFFRNGANPTGLLVNSEVELNKDTARTAKERFIAAMNSTREPVVLGKGWDWKQISIAPEESQFLETQKYSAADVARIFGPGMPEILGYPSGDPLTYSTVESRSLHLLTYTLDPWFTRVERILSGFLPNTQTVKLNRAALLRADLLTRYRAHAISIASKWTAPSEVRDIEDMPPMTAAQKDELATVPAPTLNPESITPK